MNNYGIEVLVAMGYNDGYYWDERYVFKYKDEVFQLINEGSCSGYIPIYFEIAKGNNLQDSLCSEKLLDLMESDYRYYDPEELANEAQRLIDSGKDHIGYREDEFGEREEF